MPIYEYECKNGHRTEVIQSIKDDLKDVIACAECRRLKVAAKTDGRIVRAHLIVSRTATPILKAGVGGFYKPTRSRSEES